MDMASNDGPSADVVDKVERWYARLIRPFCITHPDPAGSMALDEWKVLDIQRRGTCAPSVRVQHAFTVAIEAQAVIRTLDRVSDQPAQPQRGESMRADAEERNRTVVDGSVKHNRNVQDAPAKRLLGHLIRPSCNIPTVAKERH